MSFRLGFKLIMGLHDLKENDERWANEKDRQDWPNKLVTELPLDYEIPERGSTTQDLDRYFVALELKNLNFKHYQSKGEWLLKNRDVIDHRMEYGNPSVIGMIVDEQRDNEVLYALSTIYPIYDYSHSPGYYVFRSRTLDEMTEEHQWAFWLKKRQEGLDLGQSAAASMADRMQDLLDTNQNHGVNSMAAPSWARTAHYLLNTSMGMNVSLSDISLILVWEWT